MFFDNYADFMKIDMQRINYYACQCRVAVEYGMNLDGRFWFFLLKLKYASVDKINNFISEFLMVNSLIWILESKSLIL